MSYENAPATRLLATHCAACRKPLLDALSVELGIGPVCRKRYGFGSEDHPHREEANRIIHALAAEGYTPERCERLRELGFDTLADKIEDATVTIQIDQIDGRLALRTPYDPRAVAAIRQIPGRRWDPTSKRWTFPADQRARLWDHLQTHYRGAYARGPKGIFLIGA